MRVIHVAAECAPFAKAGGLADVVGALPAYLRGHGVDAAVLMPDYGRHSERPLAVPGELRVVHRGAYRIGDRVFVYAVRRTDGPGYPLYLLDAPAHFGPAGIYVGAYEPLPNEPQRWLGFQSAATDWVASLARYGEAPGVIHAHDHHAGLIPALVKRSEAGADVREVPVVFTIHSAEHQGVYDAATWRTAGLPGDPPAAALDPDGRLNSLRAGALLARFVTTVSPTYALELQTRPDIARGLDDTFGSVADRFRGILNGIDPAVWNPAVDPHIAAPYGPDDMAGKAACKRAVCEEMGVDAVRPLVVYVGRLMEEKGAEILPGIVERALSDMECSVVVLGTGEGHFEEAVREAAAPHAGRAAVRLAFDEGLAHRLYAGADVLLMPSKVEPCGLAQMYALAYGTPPVVRATGGLADTIREWDGSTGNGFRFDDFTFEAGSAALTRALEVFRRPAEWGRLQRLGMTEDNSWARAAGEYAALYREVAATVPAGA